MVLTTSLFTGTVLTTTPQTTTNLYGTHYFSLHRYGTHYYDRRLLLTCMVLTTSLFTGTVLTTTTVPLGGSDSPRGHALPEVTVVTVTGATGTLPLAVDSLASLSY